MRCTTPKLPLHGAGSCTLPCFTPSPHTPLVPPDAPDGVFPASSFQPSVTVVGPELGFTGIAPDFQVWPLSGVPAGHVRACGEPPPTVIVNPAFEQVIVGAPEPFANWTLVTLSATVHSVDVAMKFEKGSSFRQVEPVVGSKLASSTWGGAGVPAAGWPGSVPAGCAQTRV